VFSSIKSIIQHGYLTLPQGPIRGDASTLCPGVEERDVFIGFGDRSSSPVGFLDKPEQADG
jgi:hypothetical protein